MEGEEITEIELSIDELVDDALRTDYAQDFGLNVDDIAPPTINIMHHYCLVSY